MLMSRFWGQEVYLVVPVKVLPCRQCWESYITIFYIHCRQPVFVGGLNAWRPNTVPRVQSIGHARSGLASF